MKTNKKSIKKSILLIASLGLFASAQAQNGWVQQGNSTTTTKNVGIGTTPTNSTTLHVKSGLISDKAVRFEVPANNWNQYGGAMKDFSIMESGTGGNEIFFKTKLVNWGFSAISKEGDMGIFFTDHDGGSCCNQNAGFVIAPAHYQDKGGIRITNNGKVAIGSHSVPSDFKLAVDGKIICTELKVSSVDQWYDKVFDEDYKLTSLEQVEEFVKENKHLPNVPSEKEVKENGINTGEMHGILLRQIEELTLHMIELNKANELLQAKVSKMEQSK